MAIAFDTSTFGGANVGTWAHTCTGNNLILFVGVYGDTTATSPTVKYAGVTMTNIGSKQVPSDRYEYLYYLLAPGTGANNVTITGFGVTTGISASYTGVKQSGQPDANTSGTVNGTSITGTVTTVANNCWVVMTCKAGGGANPTAGASTTLRQSSNNEGFFDSNGPITPAGAKTLEADCTTTQNWACVMASFAPVAGAGTNLIQSSGTANLALGSTSAVWGSNTTMGNLIVVGVSITNAASLGTVTSITDAQSNTYLKAASGTLSSIGDVINSELWYAKNITGGAGSVTVNHSVDAAAVYVREYSGFDTLDVSGSASGSSTAPNSGTSSTTTQGTELVIVSTADDKGVTQTWTAAGNYGNIVGTATTITGVSMEDNIVTATGAQTGTLTLGAAANWDSLLATFYKSSSSSPRYRTLLGVGI